MRTVKAWCSLNYGLGKLAACRSRIHCVKWNRGNYFLMEQTMEQLVKVSRGGQVTLPAALRQAANIEIGDYLEVSLVDDHLVLSPKQLIDKSQTYFWSASWQEGEREADDDLRTGRVKSFETVDDLFAELDQEE